MLKSQSQKTIHLPLKDQLWASLKLPVAIYVNVKTILFDYQSVSTQEGRRLDSPFKCFFYFIGCTLGE